jgi:hypothetical protein
MAPALPDIVRQHWFTFAISKSSESDKKPEEQATNQVTDTIRDSLQFQLQPRPAEIELPSTEFLVRPWPRSAHVT